jgi:cytidine deaminase
VLFEFGGSALQIDGPDGVIALGDLLPWAFGPDDIAQRHGSGG